MNLTIDWDSDGNGTTEASDLGLPVGLWPTTIVVPDATGEERVFTWVSYRRDPENEIVSSKYRNGDGTVIEVFND